MDWFNGLEKILYEEAKWAGLFEHNVTKGQIREFLVNKALKSFLPDSIHVGTGQIFSTDNPSGSNHPIKSKQIDIVLFDSKFPYLKFGNGINLYPVEGTLATIEIKTRLNKSEMIKALDNCLSVMKLGINYREDDTMKEVIANIKSKKNLNNDNSIKQMIHGYMSPKTYIFGFNGFKSNVDNFLKIIKEWGEINQCGNIYYPMLPRVIATEKIVAFAKDNDWSKFDNENTVFGAIESDQRFGIFLSNIFYTVINRTDVRHAKSNMSYNITGYDPTKYYYEQIKEFKTIKTLSIGN